ncbi:MAG TPA: KpsF/GutQ family sugar-phosphate isomerase [Calditrichia bacterium]|nr:KpsF/GutQ family sugar-phosphate isomerase [Calditrichia bacterium]
MSKSPSKSPAPVDVKAVARRVIKMEAEAVTALLDIIDEQFEKAVELIYHCKGRVIVTGLGKSGNIGRKMAATLASTGTASHFLHASDGLHGDLGAVHNDDVAICLSKSGNSEELFTLMPVFRQIGVPVIAITANADSELSRNSAVVLNIGVREEACPHDLAPTSSTTATLALGDALAIALLEKRNFSREDFAFLHPAGALGKRLLLKVMDVMESGDSIAVISPDKNMKEAVLMMAAKRGICTVIDEDRHILGVITTGDLNRLVEHTEQFFAIPVTQVMNRNPKTVQHNTLAYTAYKKMENFRIIAMPVVDEEKRLTGIVHLHDLMRSGISG